MADLAVWPTDGADGSVSSEARWRKMARLWVPAGVDQTRGALLVPALIAGPAITVQPGGAWLDGHFAELAAAATIPASANGLLVVRFTPADNHAELLYRDAATTPTQTDPTWELPIGLMTAGALADRRAFANGATPTAVTAAAMKLNYPAPPDGFQCITLDDGRVYTRRVAGFTHPVVGAVPANRWECWTTYAATKTTDANGIFSITAGDLNLTGIISVQGSTGWDASASPFMFTGTMRYASQTLWQGRAHGTTNVTGTGTVGAKVNFATTIYVQAFGYVT